MAETKMLFRTLLISICLCCVSSISVSQTNDTQEIKTKEFEDEEISRSLSIINQFRNSDTERTEVGFREVDNFTIGIPLGTRLDFCVKKATPNAIFRIFKSNTSFEVLNAQGTCPSIAIRGGYWPEFASIFAYRQNGTVPVRFEVSVIEPDRSWAIRVSNSISAVLQRKLCKDRPCSQVDDP